MLRPNNLLQTAARRRDRLLARLAYSLQGDRRHKYLYISYHKCATQYVLRVLNGVCRHKHIPALKSDWRGAPTAAELRRHQFILVQDYDSTVLDIDAIAGRGFYVVRDPRDILVSTYFSHRDSHVVRDPRAFAAFEADPHSPLAEILYHRQILAECTLEDGLRLLLDSSHYFTRAMHEMKRWDATDPRFYNTSFERIVADPVAEFGRILTHLQIEIDFATVGRIVNGSSLHRMRQEWDQRHAASTSHYRKGQPGDWRNYFNDELKQLFKARHGDLLIALGYERNSDW